MNYNEAMKKLENFGQAHVLQTAEAYGCEHDKELLQQIEETDFSVIEQGINCTNTISRGNITPIEVLSIDEIQKNEDAYRSLGRKTIESGKVAAVLLAGGMGTRLGSDEPKGVYDIGVTKRVYIFERIVCNLKETVNEAGAYIYLFVMTSDKNNDTTVDFFKQHDYFGYPEKYVRFFKQEMAPATDYNGKVLMETPSKMAASPNGNGGWYGSLLRAGLGEIISREGIEWLNVFSVDNVLQRIADPCFVGATIANKCVSASKVIRKVSPDEKVGVLCLEDNHPSIVEYYELTDEMKNELGEKGEPVYNYGVTLNYLFGVKQLDEIVAMNLPPHVVEKKIPCLGKNGETVTPEEPNGYKYETLILDMIKLLPSCLGYEVVREKEFAPVKNRTGVDSVDTARNLLRLNGIEI